MIREKGGLTTKIKYRIPKKINFGGGGGFLGLSLHTNLVGIFDLPHRNGNRIGID